MSRVENDSVSAQKNWRKMVLTNRCIEAICWHVSRLARQMSENTYGLRKSKLNGSGIFRGFRSSHSWLLSDHLTSNTRLRRSMLTTTVTKWFASFNYDRKVGCRGTILPIVMIFGLDLLLLDLDSNHGSLMPEMAGSRHKLPTDLAPNPVAPGSILGNAEFSS